MTLLLLGTPKKKCLAGQLALINSLERLGFAVKWEEVTGPSQRVKFLGLLIDSMRLRLELPTDKLQKLCRLCNSLSMQKKVTERELQVGLAIWLLRRELSTVSELSRVYLWTQSTQLKKPNHRLRLTKALLFELSW